jgi:hypothetical protein
MTTLLLALNIYLICLWACIAVLLDQYCLNIRSNLIRRTIASLWPITIMPAVLWAVYIELRDGWEEPCA